MKTFPNHSFRSFKICIRNLYMSVGLAQAVRPITEFGIWQRSMDAFLSHEMKISFA